MNFQKLFGPLSRSGEDKFFDGIVGYKHTKRLFALARSHESTHIVLRGSPASAKTMFLMPLRQHLKDSYFVDCGNATKAEIIEYLFKAVWDRSKNLRDCVRIGKVSRSKEAVNFLIKKFLHY